MLKAVIRKYRTAVSTVSAISDSTPFCFPVIKTCDFTKKTVKELGYRPNPIVSSLRIRNPHTIGVIAPNFHTHMTLINLEILEDLAWRNRYLLFIGYSQNSTVKEKKKKYIPLEFLVRPSTSFPSLPTGIHLAGSLHI